MTAQADALMSIFGFKRVKTRKCSYCREHFQPFRMGQKACSVECACQVAREKREKEERKADKVKRDKLKSRSDWIKDAQTAFNAFIRERDKDKPCICCGNPLGESAIGGGYDAGHYRSIGSAPHLRFDERNCHAQRKHCNRYGAGRAVDYRIGLIKRMGIEVVTMIETDQSTPKWTIDDLKSIRDTYRAKLKELKNGIE